METLEASTWNGNVIGNLVENWTSWKHHHTPALETEDGGSWTRYLFAKILIMAIKKNTISRLALTERRLRPAASRFGTTFAKSCKVWDKVKFLLNEEHNN